MDSSKIKINIDRPSIICLTPVKNEAWILDRFLKAASLWADLIIIADQMSTDGSRDIAKRYPKVVLIDNNNPTYDEQSRQKLLINEARKIKGPRLLITLDADEIFTPNIFKSSEWQTILNSKPGTVFYFRWANLRPEIQTMWLGGFSPWGYMDDGFDHQSADKIHSTRIPIPINNDSIYINEIKVIHFQYIAWERMQSKHRWYECFEAIHYPNKKAVDIFRMYHHMYEISVNHTIPTPQSWFEDYNDLGIDISSTYHEKNLWWDEQVLENIEKYGASYFKKLSIWDVNWEKMALLWGKANVDLYKDPRNGLDKCIQKWLRTTQIKHHKFLYRNLDRILRLIIKY